MIDLKNFLRETELTAPIIHPPGEGKAVGVLGARSTFKVLNEQTGGAYAVLEQEVLPSSGPPLHIHRHETEIFYILEGEFELTIGDRRLTAAQGAIMVGPRNIPHKFRNMGSTTGRLLLVVIPGRFAEYFLEVDSAHEPDLATIKSLCAKYDVEILE